MHAVTTRADVCSVRVCETSLSVLELLLDLGVVSTTDKDHTSEQEGPTSNYAANSFDQDLSSNSHGICIDIVARQVARRRPSCCTKNSMTIKCFLGCFNMLAARTAVAIPDGILRRILFDRKGSSSWPNCTASRASTFAPSYARW